jgi:hypothetical protein
MNILLENAIFWDIIPCGITAQKMAFFIVTAMKTSTLTM